MLLTDRYLPILLKKSVLVTTAKKLAPEIEILKFGKELRAQISRNNAQKRCFHRSLLSKFRQSDFFNRISRFPPFESTLCAVKSDETTGDLAEGFNAG